MIDNLHLAGHRTNEYSYRVLPLAGTEGRKSWTRIGTFSSCRPRLTLLDTFCWSSLNSCTSQTCCSPYSFGTFHQVCSCSCQCSHTILGELQELHILLHTCLNHTDSVSCSHPRPDLLGTSSCHRSYPICRTHTCYNHNRTGNHHLQHHHTLWHSHILVHRYHSLLGMWTTSIHNVSWHHPSTNQLDNLSGHTRFHLHMSHKHYSCGNSGSFHQGDQDSSLCNHKVVGWLVPHILNYRCWMFQRILFCHHPISNLRDSQIKRFALWHM